MSQLVLNRGNSYHQSLFKKLLPKNFELGPYFLISSLLMFVALITVTTLMFSTRQVTKGYELNLLEAQHESLVRGIEVHDMKISEMRALSAIESSDKVSRMVTPRNIVFVNGDTTIASR